jgi:hypothetical protein
MSVNVSKRRVPGEDIRPFVVLYEIKGIFVMDI